MSGHTPGPWRACSSGQVVDKSGSRQIGRIWNTRDRLLDSANARLIAAAPELLDALEALLYDAECFGMGNKARAFAQAQAAVSKAKGEQ